MRQALYKSSSSTIVTMFSIIVVVALSILMGCNQTTTPSGITVDVSQVESNPKININFTENITDTEIIFAPGSLLKSSDDPGVFYLNEQQTRQHIYDWDTFLNLGFDPNEIRIVSESALTDIPLTGELTRLVHDSELNEYWAVNGEFWPISTDQDAYNGSIISTPADSLLLTATPILEKIPDNQLLQDKQTSYISLAGTVYPLSTRSLFIHYGFTQDEAIEIPNLKLEAHAPRLSQYVQAQGLSSLQNIYQIINGKRQAVSYDQFKEKGQTLDNVSLLPNLALEAIPLATSLTVIDKGANLREGPGTDYHIVGYAPGKLTLNPIARNHNNTWFKVRHEKENVWVAASVAKFAGDIGLLPIETSTATRIVAVQTPTATPTPVASAIVCDEIPIRGFGLIWSNNPQIQPELGCPHTWQAGEHGTNAAVQVFEHGAMLWLERDQVHGVDPVYVLFNDDKSYYRFRDLGAADADKVEETPQGFYPVGDKFSKVYWEGTGVKVKERLGHAVTESKDSAGSFQSFRQGQMFWIGEIDQIFVTIDYTRYFKNRPSIRTRYWLGYEDTF
ncbi:MAG: SH3 domain-containing protein [Chloroflexota bacterium]